ncbi:MAG: starch synthase, partial [Planctomycetota bacterium]
LEDTLVELNEDGSKGTGALFSPYESEALVGAVDRARELHKKQKDWKPIVKRCMEEDFSWEQSAREYQKAYRKVGRMVKAESR